MPLLAFVLGAIFGSFANVLIYRIPRGESVIWPGSRCPACGHPLRWWENVPLLSFALLRGRCAACAAPISWRYPLVELGVALIFAYAVARHGLSWDALSTVTLGVLLVVVFFIDLEHRIVPDRLTLPGMVLGLLLSFARAGLPGFFGALLSGIGAGGVLMLVALLSRGGMGGGDIKLAAMLGCFLGWPRVAVGMFAGVLLGGLGAFALLVAGRKSRKDYIPFGPALALGGFVGMEWGSQLLSAYLRLFGL
ncbi:MAG: prepilin peptidase [Armatimonadota bacterium]|nr:prepilin peptidase [Armatimonadota bacterium]MDR7440129.1 prepilin peptidase [Armatimonadota bacterium]MDR7562602.1 prepilin peptidase [Armatimonadota bacterium]MDR7568098.1 prepilin peptidase [Armatimonadota bacterium]MDR7602480.1 prepilin peptidase [Armatimonadota bacterium]